MTNIRLDPALWTRVKSAANERGTTLERWVAEALEAHLQTAPSWSGHAPAVQDERAPDRTIAPTAKASDGLPETPEARADELQALRWRVQALEAAVDYLAGVVGAGFPPGSSRKGSQPRPPELSAPAGAEER